MTDVLKKVQSGDRLRIPARAYNSFVDAANDLRQRQQNRQQQATPHQRDSGIILVRNSAGSNCPRFGVLGISAPIVAPGIGEEFKNRIALDGVVPSDPAHVGRFVITLEPAKTSQIVSAVVSGACVVQIDVEDEAHGYAEIDDGNFLQLRSATSGSRILWKESGTGTKWAIVHLGVAPSVGMIPVKVWQDGGSTDGNATSPCDRTYTVQSLDGVELGTALSPQKKRPPRGKLVVPESDGPGVIGTGYFSGSSFNLFDANETLDTEACDG